MLNISIFFLILIVILRFANKNIKNLAYLYAFFIPFYGVVFEIGLQVTPEKMVTFSMLLYMIISKNKARLSNNVAIYLFFIFLVTIFMSFLLPDYADQFPLVRGRLRWVFQIFYFLMAFAPVYFVPMVLKNQKDIYKFISIFVISVLIQCILALTQYFLYSATGFDLFPIGLFNATEENAVRTALFGYEGNTFFRICALAGEPKHLAYITLDALLFVYAYILIKGRTIKTAILFSLLGIVIILTYSTQGIILLALDLLLFPVIYAIYTRKKLVQSFILFLSVFILAILIWNYSDAGSLLKYRTVDRLSDSGVGETGIEDFDLIILSYFEDNPLRALIGTGLGNIHFFTVDYIPQELMYYAYGNVYASKKGVIKIISETGIFSLFLFIAMFHSVIFNISHLKIKNGFILNNNILITATPVLSIIIVINYFFTCDGPLFYTFILSVLFSLRNAINSSMN